MNQFIGWSYWKKLKVIESSKLNQLKKEADELLAIFVSSIKKAKGI